MEEHRAKSSEAENFFVRLLDDLLGNCGESAAFDAINPVVEYALKEVEADLFYRHIQFLIALGRKANTSEVPSRLKQNASVLFENSVEFGEPQIKSVRELFRWFRISLNE